MPCTRRGFLRASGGLVGLCLTGGCSAGGGGDDAAAPPDLVSLPDLIVNDLRTCAGDIDAGLATDVALNCARRYTDTQTYGFFICHDAGGLYAVSAICTHLGCLVSVFGACSAPYFGCPCHGSTYAYDGTLTLGAVPGQASLDHFALCITAEGRCTVDLNTVVDPSTRA
jgi:nitrite reductase/ring-hydroxylating ferredoxin subunit